MAFAGLRLWASLPASIDHNRLEVTGRVNGADTALVIDTGSERTLLTTGTVTALALPRSERSGTVLTGLGGAVRNADTFADLELGAIAVRQRLAVADVAGTGGIVGADLLRHFGGALTVHLHRFRSLAIGGDRLVGPIGVADFQLPLEAEMLLGVDYLRIRRVWVSYRTGQLFIQFSTVRRLIDRQHPGAMPAFYRAKSWSLSVKLIVMLITVGAHHAPATIAGFDTLGACEASRPAVAAFYRKASRSTAVATECLALPGQPHAEQRRRCPLVVGC